tara:strand:- start:5611 stop:5892 length:282 start_codon:yes stop_codon:yes gene_type:complete
MNKIKILLLSTTLLASFSVLSETTNIIENGQCVLIKENKLTDYLPEEDVNNFLENRFIDKIETKNINYSIQEVNRNVNRRVKTYKVCAEYKGN